jgi:hypothetical protein
MALNRKHNMFPFDLFDVRDFPGEVGKELLYLQQFSMFPPYPWGQWMYDRLIDEKIHKIEGDFIEFGVGRGGMSLFLGKRAKKFGKHMYCLDSFEGLPNLNPEYDNPVFMKGDYGPNFQKDNLSWLDKLKEQVNILGLVDTIRILPGFFEDTIQNLPDTQFSFVHIDCDLYDSVRHVLDNIWDQVSEGGIVVLDDFFHPAQGPFRAASTFFNSIGICPKYHISFPYTVFVIKGEKHTLENSHFSVDGNIYDFSHLREESLFIENVKLSIENARQSSNNAALANAELFLELLEGESSGKESEIYGYWYTLREFWNGFQDHRKPREVYLM